LGEGGFGSVDLARNIITKEFAAIKIVKPDKNSNSNDIDMIFK
jgi:serine/threonine protein kinase